MEHKYRELIENSERDIRNGQAAAVIARLTKVNTKSVPRVYRLPIANLCRRLGENSLGLRLLSKIVRPVGRTTEAPSTPHETAEYAVLLLRSGVQTEAVSLLSRIDPDVVPETLLMLSFFHFSQWNYLSAEPLLRRYTKYDLKHYSRLVGLVNLCSALIANDKTAEAGETLRDVLAEARHAGLRRIEGNCLEQLAQIEIKRGHFSGARNYLTEADAQLARMGTRDHLFVKKWSTICEALQNRTTLPLQELKQLARERRDWETVREADHHLLKISFDQPLFDHLFFGTPYPSYRDSLCRNLGRRPSAGHYVLGGDAGPLIDFESGDGGGLIKVDKGGKCAELMSILMRDFYRPKTLGGLFAELYTNERFDIYSSPARVHQVMARTRRLMTANGLPVTIEEHERTYRLKLTGPVRFRLPLDRRSLAGYPFDLNRLARMLPLQQTFTARQARELLGMKRTTFQRLLAWGENQKLILRQGTGQNTIYILQSSVADFSKAA
ncbi:MAG: hypothetical protein AB7F86_01015 [Bdellovibrionales bacterium]